MKIAQHIWPIIFGVCILAGGITGYVWQTNKKAHVEAAPHSSEEARDTRTDALSLQLFQHVLNDKTGNVIVAPGIVHDLLRDLQTIAGGKTLDAINALPISPEPSSHIDRFSLVAADINLHRTTPHQNILTLPLLTEKKSTSKHEIYCTKKAKTCPNKIPFKWLSHIYHCKRDKYTQCNNFLNDFQLWQ